MSRRHRGDAHSFRICIATCIVEVFGQDTEHQGGIGWRRMVYLSTRAGYSMMVVTCVDRLLQKENSLWWEGRDKGRLIRRAASRLVGQPDQPWAVTNAFRFTNRYIESQFVGRALGFHTSELPMPGCHATPFQGHLACVAKARRRLLLRIISLPICTPTRPGPICRADRAKAGFRVGTRSTFHAGAAANSKQLKVES